MRSVVLDPARLRAMFRAHREAQKGRIGDPDAETRRLANVYADCERKRAKNQEMFRADAMTLEELRRSLAALVKVRTEAEEAHREAEERRRAAGDSEAEGETLIRAYEGFAARDFDALRGDARREVYNPLGSPWSRRRPGASPRR